MTTRVSGGDLRPDDPGRGLARPGWRVARGANEEATTGATPDPRFRPHPVPETTEPQYAARG